MLLEPIDKSEHARLRSPSQIRVIDMLQSKPGRLSRRPFEIWREQKCQLIFPKQCLNNQGEANSLSKIAHPQAPVTFTPS